MQAAMRFAALCPPGVYTNGAWKRPFSFWKTEFKQTGDVMIHTTAVLCYDLCMNGENRKGISIMVLNRTCGYRHNNDATWNC